MRWIEEKKEILPSLNHMGVFLFTYVAAMPPILLLSATGFKRRTDVLAPQLYAKDSFHLGQQLNIWRGLAAFIVIDNARLHIDPLQR